MLLLPFNCWLTTCYGARIARSVCPFDERTAASYQHAHAMTTYRARAHTHTLTHSLTHTRTNTHAHAHTHAHTHMHARTRTHTHHVPDDTQLSGVRDGQDLHWP